MEPRLSGDISQERFRRAIFRITIAVLAPFFVIKWNQFQEQRSLEAPFDSKRWKEVRRSYEATKQNGAEFRLLAEKAVHQRVLIGKSYEDVVNLLDLHPKALNKKETLYKGYTVTLPDGGLFFPLTFPLWLAVRFDESGEVSAVDIWSD